MKHRCIALLANCLSWITKPCTKVFYKYQLASHLRRKRRLYLVLQPGKVASKSILEIVKKVAKVDPIYHLHYVNESEVTVEQHGPTGRYLLFPQISNFNILGCFLKNFAKSGGEINIICGVRDPWSRCRSAFLQNLESILVNQAECSIFRSPLKLSKTRFELQNLFNRFNFDFGITWFDKILYRLTEIDVYQYPFPIEKGCLCIKKNTTNLFLYRFDRLYKSEVSEGLNTFLGIRKNNIKPPKVNDTEKHLLLVKKVINSLQIPETISSSFASCKVTRHFFTSDEIAEYLKNDCRSSNNILLL